MKNIKRILITVLMTLSVILPAQAEQNFYELTVRKGINASAAVTTLGKVKSTIKTCATSCTAAPTDSTINVSSVAAERTVTLASCNGRVGYRTEINNVSGATTNDIILDGYGSDTIGGSATKTMDKSNASIEVMCISNTAMAITHDNSTTVAGEVNGNNDFTGTNTFLGFGTDTISEKTAATGVTIDGVLLKDSGAVFGAPNVYKSATTLTALAGGAQAGTALASEYNEFTVVATALDSAQLPTPVLGTKRVVRNSSTAKVPMVVFGQTGASINTASANAGFLVGYGETVTFTAISTTVWKTDGGTPNAVTSGVITEERTLTATEIVGTSAGDLGHASGAELVSAPGTGYALEFIGAIAIYDFDTAAYTGGGNDTTINLGSGGAVITGVVSSANLLGAAGDKIVRFSPLSTAALPVTAAVGISINSVTAWTQPGTAAGVLRVQTSYRIHKTGL